jgi:hypothetical protein
VSGMLCACCVEIYVPDAVALVECVESSVGMLWLEIVFFLLVG